MKKSLAIVLTLLMIWCSLSLGVFTVSAETYSGFCGYNDGENITWSFDTETGVLDIVGTGKMDWFSRGESPWYSYVSDIKTVNVSEGVTNIGESSFYNCTNLTEVNLPDSITELGWYSFENCSGLIEISLPDNLKKICGDAFSGCTLLKSIVIPDSVTYIGSGAFEDCASITVLIIPNGVTCIYISTFNGCTLLESITIPNSVTEIDSRAFENCTSLTSISIPNSVTEIDSRAFENCTSLTSISIPNSVTEIGNYAFAYCTLLESITLSDSLETIGYYVFYNTAYYNNADNWTDNVLYIGKHLIKAKDSFSGSYTVKDGTKTIAYDAFGYCSGLTAITFPSSLRHINQSAFSKCIGLTSITFPNKLKTIGWNAFWSCTGLKSVVIPDNVTSISDVFSSCTALKSVHIGKGVTYLSGGYFSNCDSLKTITVSSGNKSYYAKNNCVIDKKEKEIVLGCKGSVIPTDKSIKKIRNYAFEYCKTLESIKIPDNIEEIGYSAFEGCTALKTVTFGKNISIIGSSAFEGCTALKKITLPSSVNSISSDAFDNTGYYNTASNWKNNVLYIGNFLYKAKTEISGACTVKSGTKYIVSAAFEDCTALTSVTFPESVIEIGSAAFKNCTALKSAKLGKNVSHIGPYTFRNCSKLSSVNIPSKIEEIQQCTFQNCTSLKSITISSKVYYIGYSAFGGCTALNSITLPDSYISMDYSAFDNTGYYNNASNWENGVLYIGKNLYKAKTSISGKYSIKKGTKAILSNAFSGCTGLTEISIPDSVLNLPYGVFKYCSGIKKLHIGKGVTNMIYEDDNGFNFDCASLEEITVSEDNPRYVSKNNCLIDKEYNTLVIGCKNSVIPTDKSVEVICARAFANATGLTKLTIPKSVKVIGNNFVNGCDNLNEITIKSNDLMLAYEVFDGCGYYDNLDNWEDGVLYIGKHLVKAKEDIADGYVIKDGTETVASYSFEDCINLTSIEIPDGVTTIGVGAFYDCENLKNITIPDSINNIWPEAFRYTAYVKDESNWQNGVLYIGNHLIDTNDDLPTDYTIKSGTVSIAGEAFRSSDITSVTIPNTVKTIGAYAFQYCDELKSLKIPSSVTSIGYNISAFGYEYPAFDSSDNNIESITVDSKNTVYRSKNNCLIERDTKELILGCKNSVIPTDGSVKTIGYKAFYGCDGLKSITIPNSVKQIEHYNFLYCDNLTSVTVPKSVTKIGDSCFRNNAEDFTVKGYVNSYAEAYVDNMHCSYNVKFTPIDVKYKLSKTSYAYSGKACKPTVSVTYTGNKKLASGNYTVKYAKGLKNVGKYKVTVTLKENYSGTKTLYFTINPAATKITKVTAGTKSLKVAYSKKTAQVTGYQIQYSTKKNFSGVKTKTVTSYKTSSATIKSLKAKKTYYVRVRTYKTVSGKKYYSAWSKTLSKKTK